MVSTSSAVQLWLLEAQTRFDRSNLEISILAVFLRSPHKGTWLQAVLPFLLMLSGWHVMELGRQALWSWLEQMSERGYSLLPRPRS